MKFRQWYLGVATASAALIPFAAMATPLPSAPSITTGSTGGDVLSLHLSGVNADTGNVFNPTTGDGGFDAFGNAGDNHGSCTGGANCAQTSFAAGTIDSVVDQNAINLWSSGTGGVNNPSGARIGFVVYGIADLSVETHTSAGKITSETVDNTGAVWNQAANGGLGASMDGKIHIDLYYMPNAANPTFNGGANNVTAAAVSQVTDTSNSNVFGADAKLFGAFTLQQGVTVLNPDVDGTSNSAVTLSETVTLNPNFTTTKSVTFSSGSDTITFSGANTSGMQPGDLITSTKVPAGTVVVSINGNTVTMSNAASASGAVSTTIHGVNIAGGTDHFFATCNNGDLCTQLANVPESALNNNQDATVASVLATIFATVDLDKTAPSGGNVNQGWTTLISDPVVATTPVPEPTSLALLGSGLGLLGLAIRRRRRKGAA